MQCKGTLIEEDQQFGAWLCAPTLNMKKCLIVRVEGMEDDKFCERAHDDPEEDGEEMDTKDHGLEGTLVAAPEISGKAQAGKVGAVVEFLESDERTESIFVISGDSKAKESSFGANSDF